MPRGRPNKDKREYFARVYEMNKMLIENRVGDIPAGGKEWFIDTAMSYMKYDHMSASEAAKYVGKTEAFRTRTERKLENMWTGLRKDQKTWSTFKKVAKLSNMSQVKWSNVSILEQDKVFLYGGNTVILSHNSPEGFEIMSLSSYQTKMAQKRKEEADRIRAEYQF